VEHFLPESKIRDSIPPSWQPEQSSMPAKKWALCEKTLLLQEKLASIEIKITAGKIILR
jgi:hypothetical protein